MTDALVLTSSLTQYRYGSADACSAGCTFKPGDIISISGHCFLSLGQCSDGSVVLLHSTRNGGMQVSNIVNSIGSSQASRQAQSFVQQNHPHWWANFDEEGRQRVSASIYLNGTKFTWSENALVEYPCEKRGSSIIVFRINSNRGKEICCFDQINNI